jgi:hypothetical protein
VVYPSQCRVHRRHLHLVPVSSSYCRTWGRLFKWLTFHRFIAVFLCTPVSNYWMVGSPDGSCLDEGVITLICGIINCVADFATTVTPIPLIMGVSTLMS